MEVQEIYTSRPWLKHYPKGIPAEINPDVYPSIKALMEDSFRKFAGNQAFICMGKSITYTELDKLTRDFGAYLQSLGLQKGDKIAIQMPNVIQYPVAMFGGLACRVYHCQYQPALHPS